MPAVNDVYQLRLKYTVREQRFMNVFHYQATGIAGTASQCRQAVNGQLFPQLQAIMSSETVWGTWEVQNLDDPTDFASVTFTAVGGRSGTYSTTHDAFSFTYESARADAQSGGKRFGAVAASDMIDGLPAPALITPIATLEAALATQITIAGCTYRPRIYGKRRAQLGTFANPVASVNFLGITTQNTRKFYTSPGW